MPLYISPPPSNPLSRLLMAAVGLVALVASFMLGLVALAVVVGLGLVAAVVFWLRVAWIRRRIRKEGISGVTGTGQAQAQARTQADREDTLDAEYTVVETRRDP